MRVFAKTLGMLCLIGALYSKTIYAQENVFTGQYALCPGVSSAVVHPIQLGSLRLRNGASGWVYLDGKGELYSSANVSKNPAFPPSNGLVRIRGPQQHRVHIELVLLPWYSQKEPEQAAKAAEMFAIHSLQVFSQGNMQVEHVVNNEYVVILPTMQDAEYVEVELLLGLEAQVSMMSGPQQITTSVQLRCLGIEHQ